MKKNITPIIFKIIDHFVLFDVEVLQKLNIAEPIESDVKNILKNILIGLKMDHNDNIIQEFYDFYHLKHINFKKYTDLFSFDITKEPRTTDKYNRYLSDVNKKFTTMAKDHLSLIYISHNFPIALWAEIEKDVKKIQEKIC